MAANDSEKLAQSHPPHRPIDTLFPCLAVVLGETGKFFRNPALHDSKHLNYTKGKLNKLITGANQEFQDALDEIEIEILEAKDVFKRDLALFRTRRAERDRAAAGLKPHSPNNGEDMSTTVNGNIDNVKIDSKESLRNEPEAEENDSKDVTMTNGQWSSGGKENGIEIGEIELSVLGGEDTVMKPRMDAGIDDAVAAAISVEAPEIAKEQTKTDPIDDETTTQPAHSSGTPTVPDFQDVNFESMFNDSGTADDNDQMDFDLGFVNDTNTDQDFLNESAFENITINNEDVKNLTTTSNEDINTLLPGLENYVNAGNDFSLTDIPASNSPALPDAANMSGLTDTTVSAPLEQAPLESNFDDFFASGNYMDAGGDEDMGGDGGFGDFDDSWFGTDVNKPDRS